MVFKIYFAILHKIVARNNVQQSIRLNKQKEKQKRKGKGMKKGEERLTKQPSSGNRLRVETSPTDENHRTQKSVRPSTRNAPKLTPQAAKWTDQWNKPLKKLKKPAGNRKVGNKKWCHPQNKKVYDVRTTHTTNFPTNEPIRKRWEDK